MCIYSYSKLFYDIHGREDGTIDLWLPSIKSMVLWTISRKSVHVVVVSSPHQSPRCGVSRLRSAQSIAIPLSVRSASIAPAHWSTKSELHCRHRPLSHQKGDLTSRENSKVLAADSVGRWSCHEEATSIGILSTLSAVTLMTSESYAWKAGRWSVSTGESNVTCGAWSGSSCHLALLVSLRFSSVFLKLVSR